MTSPIENVLIVGLGLMGGSLAWAFKSMMPHLMVGGWDADELVTAEALRRGLIDRVEPPGYPHISRYQAVFVAVPVRAIPPLLMEIAAMASPGTILTDMGSTKSHIHETLERHLGAGVVYVGGHPMTGSERGGLAAADPFLFENALWVLTDPGGKAAEAARLLAALLEGVGALVVPMEPAVHDLVVSLTSHLPYLAAVAVTNALTARFADPAEALTLAAGGFLDTTRVAACPPPVFRDIFLTNRENLLAAIDLLSAELWRVKMALSIEDEGALEQIFQRAQRVRSSLPRSRRGFPVSHFEVVVKAHDRPGFLADVATLLGQRKINIKDFALLHVREGEPGTILLGFRSEEDGEQALGALASAGFTAERR
ncbi:MAG: prephenate dehydrogenase/arogenate dehydrogenase family protein [Candidatus Riflebacteria bacterium]|nr:prephenate dehydrogenase/arogenate dehydrogenase family protein [Candidatus Riflebacteria bacterium]